LFNPFTAGDEHTRHDTVPSCIGKIIKNVFERGENLLQNGIL